MRVFKFLVFVLINISLILLIGCVSKKNISTNEFLIELRTTACNGTCPVFTMQIYPNGLVNLEGEAFLDKIGKYNSKIDKATLNEIITSFENSNFFEFKESYTSMQMDLPAKYITFNKDGKSKTVMAYDNIPENLTGLINELKQLLVSLEWKKVE